jgi:hypothetical protein
MRLLVRPAHMRIRRDCESPDDAQTTVGKANCDRDRRRRPDFRSPPRCERDLRASADSSVSSKASVCSTSVGTIALPGPTLARRMDGSKHRHLGECRSPLHLQGTWPWATELVAAFGRLIAFQPPPADRSRPDHDDTREHPGPAAFAVARGPHQRRPRTAPSCPRAREQLNQPPPTLTLQPPPDSCCRVGGRRLDRAARAGPTGLVSSRRHLEPCMRFSRTRLSDVLHRRHSAHFPRQARWGLGATTVPERLISPKRFGELYVTSRQPKARDRWWRLATNSASRLCA